MEILKFSAEWCAPCKQLAKVISSISLQVTEIDVDKEPETAAKYRVRTIPTMISIKEGNVVDTLIGSKTEKEILNWIEDCEGV